LYVFSARLCYPGAKVYIACRDSELGKAAAAQLMKMTGSKEIHFLPLRLNDLKDVKRFCEDFKKS